MSILQNPLGIHGTALKLREQRIAVLASNIANVDTPNYKARDLDFRSVMAATQSKGMSTSHARHIGVTNYQALEGEGMVKYRTTAHGNHQIFSRLVLGASRSQQRCFSAGPDPK